MHSSCGQVVKTLLGSSGFIYSSENPSPTLLGCQMSFRIRRKKGRRETVLVYCEWLNF